MLYIAADSTLANFAVESLKQINNSAGAPVGTDDNTVVVAAQFAIDAPGGQMVPRYIFDKCSHGTIKNSLKEPLNAPVGMTEQQALISFLQWAYSEGTPKDAEEKHYALILWGHGPQLLLQPAPGGQSPCGPNGNRQSATLFLTPEELRIALQQGLQGKPPLDIIAFDNCSMSMFEAAYEIQDLAQYMVASQEEVPDPSFPYDTLIGLFRRLGGGPAKDPKPIEDLLAAGVEAYVGAYQDYIFDEATGLKEVTLSALRLSQCSVLKDAVRCLACALLDAQGEPRLPSLLLETRRCARDFVGGLYVDLYEFCLKLETRLSAGIAQNALQNAALSGTQKTTIPDWRQKIINACLKVIKALIPSRSLLEPGERLHLEPGSRPDGQLVLANSSADPTCHGVSLYLPYLSEEQYAEMNQPMVKGGRDTGGKGFDLILNRAASSLLLCARRDLILVTEGYYADLRLSRDTDWDRFITEVWSRILIDQNPDDLDRVYSAQQSAVNVDRASKLGQWPGSDGARYQPPEPSDEQASQKGQKTETEIK
jgi:hypothetical protein